MKLVLSRRATRRLHEISDYIREHDPTAARNVRQSIQDAFTLIVAHPGAGRAIDLGLRRFVVPRLPYLIYYKVNEAAGEVVIITVRHAAQSEPRAP